MMMKRFLPYALLIAVLSVGALGLWRVHARQPETVLTIVPKATATGLTVDADGTINPLKNGVVADAKTDDTAAWVKFLAALVDGNVVKIPPGTAGSLVNASLDLNQLSGVTFYCPSVPDARPRGQRGGFEFLWGGMAGQDHVLGLIGCHACEVSGIAVSCDAPSSAPVGWASTAVGIRINDAATTTPRYVSTRNTLDRCTVTPPKPVAGTPGAFTAVYIGPSKTNNDFLTVRRLVVMPVSSAINWGNGITLDASPNGYSERFEDCSITGATVAINQVDGMLACRGCSGTSNGVDIQVGQCSARSVFEGCNFEQTRGTLAIVSGSNAPVEIVGCRWSGFTISAGQPCFVTTAKILSVRGNVVRSANASAMQSSWPIAFQPQSATAAYGLDVDSNVWEYTAVSRPTGFLPCRFGALDWQRGF
jgi:hypothetical protein